ncbi:MAG: protoporphyrinogen oxidase [Acidobacteria bacterium]|nr:protoporphyrinogen oxidase [Acidobacteriota bacterium]
MSVIIVGAGITGLAAAYELSLRRVPFTVLEAAPRAGGLILTEHIDGVTIEAGPDSVLAQKPAATALCEELGLGPRLISTTPPRAAFVLKRGTLYPLPSPAVLGIPTTLKGTFRYDLLPWGARLRLAIEPLIPRGHSITSVPSECPPPGPSAAGDEDESVAAFFRRRFGPATVDLLAEPLLGGIHAGDVESLSVRSLFPRFVEAEARHGSVRRAFHGTRAHGRADLFRSLSSGMGELIAALERRLPAGALRCNAAVQTIRAKSGRWEVESAGGLVAGDAVIVAAPAHAAARVLALLDERSASLCAAVPYASTASVTLAWPRGAVRHPLAGSGFVVARKHNDVRIAACTWVSSKWAGRAPVGFALLRAFVGGVADPAAVDMTDDQMIDSVRRDLAGILGIDTPPALARVHRWRDAGAQHTVGHLARVTEIETRLSTNHPGVFVTGSGFRALGVPDCIADGRNAAASAAPYVKIGR